MAIRADNIGSKISIDDIRDFIPDDHPCFLVEKIKSVLSKHYNKTWKRFYKRVKKESENADKIQDNSDYDQKFFGKK